MSGMNWRDRIARARNLGWFTNADMIDANNWVTCACGEQDPKIPRMDCGAPFDEELGDLGTDFSNAVADHLFDWAEETLDKIERRATVVLAEGGA